MPYKKHSQLPLRDHESYDRMYNLHVRSKKKLASRSLSRTQKKEAMSKISKNKHKRCVEEGFEDCRNGATDRREQKKLEGLFFRWQEETVTKDFISGLTVLGRNKQTKEKANDYPRYTLQLNRNYGSRRRPNWKDQAMAQKSQLPNAGYGLFSAVRLEEGEIFGVYMGKKTTPEDDLFTHDERPYLMSGVADGEGGIGSNKPALLGMHLINDPQMEGKPRSNLKVNLCVHTDGALVACRRINVGDELFFSYSAERQQKK